MKIWKVIKQFSIGQLTKLGWLLIQKPVFIIPTIQATKRTMVICDRLYGKAHHKNGKANAFRHALWNVLIAKKVFDVCKNGSKSIVWAKKITDLHEKISPNERLAEAMDLHNNRVGRDCFESLKELTEDNMIFFFTEKLINAKLLLDNTPIEEYADELVYLSEEKEVTLA